MAKFRKGNMLNHLDECDYACITTNSMVKKDGRLVMGRGIAQQVRDSFPDIDLDFGKTISMFTKKLPKYNIIKCQTYKKFIAFQVKYHWADKADLDLINNSCHTLVQLSEFEKGKTFFLNFPGIGNGQLSREEVLPIVEALPDNIVVWEM